MKYKVSICIQDQEFQRRVIIHCKRYSVYLCLNKIETMLEKGPGKSVIKFNTAPLVLWHYLPVTSVLNPVNWPSSYCSLLSAGEINPFILILLDNSMMFVINHQLFLFWLRRKQMDHKFCDTPWVLILRLITLSFYGQLRICMGCLGIFTFPILSTYAF